MPQTLTQRPTTQVAPSHTQDWRPLADGEALAGTLRRTRHAVRGFELAPLVWIDAAIILTLGALGALEFFTTAHLGLFNLDAEGSLPAAFSGTLLLCAALVSLTIYYEAQWSRRDRQVLWLIGGFLSFMAMDEMLGIHEHIGAIIGTPWQIPYLPLAAAGGLVWLAVLRILLADLTAAALWIAGAAAWVGSQALEAVQTVVEPQGYDNAHGVITLHGLLTIPEEMGEMIGSTLFLLALIVFLRAGVSRLRSSAAAQAG